MSAEHATNWKQTEADRGLDNSGQIVEYRVRNLVDAFVRDYESNGVTMFRLYSKGCEYALRALLQFAPAKGNERFQAEAICREAGIPESFARKVFQSLAHGGFLKAFRGPGGGYALTEHPSRITLLRVIEAVDGANTFDSCVMGLPQCGREKACPLHNVWFGAKQPLIAQLSKTTLQDLLDVSCARPARKSREKGR